MRTQDNPGSVADAVSPDKANGNGAPAKAKKTEKSPEVKALNKHLQNVASFHLANVADPETGLSFADMVSDRKGVDKYRADDSYLISALADSEYVARKKRLKALLSD